MPGKHTAKLPGQPLMRPNAAKRLHVPSKVDTVGPLPYRTIMIPRARPTRMRNPHYPSHNYTPYRPGMPEQ